MTDAMGFLIAVSLRAALLAAIASAIFAVAGRRHPGAFEATWKTVCAALLALPLLMLIPPLPLRGVPELSVTHVLERNVDATSTFDEATAPWHNVRYEKPSAFSDFVVPIWFTGTLVVMAWFAWGAMSLRRLIRGGLPACELARRASPHITVLESEALSTPIAVGLVRPVIVLPCAARRWSRDQVLASIAHESAHVRRHDAAWMTLAFGMCALYWFHPAAWFVRNRLRLAAEMASDEAAAEVVGRAEYVGALADIAAQTSRGRSVRFANAMAGRSMLGRRIDSLLTRRTAPRGPHIALSVAALLLGVLAISVRAYDSTFLATNPVARRLAAEAASPDARVRAAALFKLARWRGHEEQVLPLLLSHLGDAAPVDEMPRWNFVREGWQPAMTSLQQPSPAETAALAIASFGSLGVPELEHRLRDPDPVVRRNAAWAIGEMRHPRVLSRRTVPLLVRLLQDHDPSVRTAAAWTLGDLGSQNALKPLRQALLRETDSRTAAHMRDSVEALRNGLNLEYFRHKTGG